MATKKINSRKKPAMKAKAAKSKKPTKSSKAKVVLSRLNVSITKSLHNKIKQFALKNKITAREIISSAVKEHLNKPTVVATSPDSESTV